MILSENFALGNGDEYVGEVWVGPCLTHIRHDARQGASAAAQPGRTIIREASRPDAANLGSSENSILLCK